ncbi:MAG: NAD(P)-dependent oxidoreductase [Deltaproteobacteria bacterium]|jgi:2-hydroxy-3-oxopropionate reductase|nr:NAD(P)-dependent oxidoreductase [Deltaproteobacteria bacterium]MBT4637194.1 NAD(P)-dependent oxidoreductase [Deltaproteobacteria bacterium]
MGTKVGFIGLGIMGMPMATNLLNAGYEMVVFDISQEAVKEMVALGATEVKTPREAAEICEFVVTMLPEIPHNDKVYLGKDGLIEGAHEGLMLIDCSTTDSVSTIRIHDEVVKKGIKMIDAPVMGIRPNAEQGTLVMDVGGEADDVEACRGILETVGARVVHAGPIGSGKMLKLVNNLMQGTFLCMVAEAISLVKATGVDLEVFIDLFKGNLARNMEFGVFKIAAKNFDPLFKTSLMLKDMRLGLQTAGLCGASTPMAAVAKDMLQMTANHGRGDNDCTSVYTLYENHVKK